LNNASTCKGGKVLEPQADLDLDLDLNSILEINFGVGLSLYISNKHPNVNLIHTVSSAIQYTILSVSQQALPFRADQK
jgi:hypothetical protein